MISLGIIFGLTAALLKAVKSIYQKRCANDTDDFVTGWSNRFFGILAILPFFLVNGVPELGRDYLLLLAVAGVISASASILIARAYRLSDVSLVSPIFAFVPLLMLVTSPLMLGEFPSLKGVVGVLLIVVGAYILKAGKEGFLKPFKLLFRERGIQAILLVVLLYSIAANISKLGVQSSDPVFWAFTTYTVSASFQLPIMVMKSSGWKKNIEQNWMNLMMLGAVGGLSVIAQNFAYQLTLAVYVIALKRMSIPMSVLAGSIVYDEADLGKRLLGSTIMVIGAIIISLAI